MMRKRLVGLLAVSLVLALLAAACGSGRDDSDDSAATTQATDEPEAAEVTEAAEDEVAAEGEAEGEAPTTTEAAADDGEAAAAGDVDMFGDIPWPCGPGDASGATDQGVTDDKIVIGSGNDRGFPSAPGLNEEMSHAAIALVDKCNELGGINGRQLELEDYDAAIFDVGNVMLDACDQVFMLVGEGFSLDNVGEETRVGCELAAVPAWSVSAAFAHGPQMNQAVPNPSDQQAMSLADYVAGEFPEEIPNSATMFGNFAATIETKDKVLASWPDLGYAFGTNLEYNVNGEDDWTPFVLQLRENGAEHVYFTGSCIPNYQAFRQAGDVNELEAIYTVEANFYVDACREANSDGAMDNTFIRMVFIPFEEADINKATQDYVDLIEESGGSPSLLAMQTTTNFFLWATAAQACGSDLTRECVIEEIGKIEEWTGGGLHVPTKPTDNNMPECGLVMKLEGTEYVRVFPEEPGTFACDEEWRKEITTEWSDAALLDENRVSTLYTGG